MFSYWELESRSVVSSFSCCCPVQHSTAHLMWFHNCFIGKTKRKTKTRQQFICNPHCQMVVIYKIDCFQWIWHHTIGFSKPTVYLTQIATHKFTSNTHTHRRTRTHTKAHCLSINEHPRTCICSHTFYSQQTNTHALPCTHMHKSLSSLTHPGFA